MKKPEIGDLTFCGNPFKSSCDENQWSDFRPKDKLIIRKSLRCNCDGVDRSEKAIETDHDLGKASLYQWTNVVNQFTKGECGMCPWSYYKTDPLIQAVFHQKQQGIINTNLILHDKLPQPLWEAVLIFYTYLENCKQEFAIIKERERERIRKESERN